MSSSHFRVVRQFKVDHNSATFTKYESTRTGLTVVVVDGKGPIIYGYFAVATEIHTDSGAPHTLEHACFMGSKRYPYNGAFEKLTSRSGSSSNAYTMNDQTVYEVTTSGWLGFSELLPVYLDAILFPTLTDSVCYTEVHHINEEGHDAGVVYSEMQAWEHQMQVMIENASHKLVYPEGVGFRYETGGMLAPLRELSGEMIRAFHKSMYEPKNLCLNIIGEVDHDDLLNVLDKFEDTIIDEVPPLDAPFKRPFLDSKQPEPIMESTVTYVDVPEGDESSGQIGVRFLGPSLTDQKSMAAMDVLDYFLAGSPASILEKNLVEIEDPYCSSVVIRFNPRPNTLIEFELSSVQTERLAITEEKLFEVLKKTVDEPLDLKYMHDCIKRSVLSTKDHLEDCLDSYHDTIALDHVYGNRDGSDLEESVKNFDAYDELYNWSEKDWRDFIKKWFVDNPHVSILARPSVKFLKTVEQEDEERVKKQIERLGPDGLEKLRLRLEEVQKENSREIPEQILRQFDVPPVSSIHYLQTETGYSGLALPSYVAASGNRKQQSFKWSSRIQQILDEDATDVPLYFTFEHFDSDFISITILITPPSDLPNILKPLTSVYVENFFSTPIIKDGKKIPFAEVVMKLDSETITYGMANGRRLGVPEQIMAMIRVESHNYQIAIDWLQALSWDSVFDVDRLKATVARLRSDIPDEKRNPNVVVARATSMITLAPESLFRSQNTFAKSKYLRRFEALLKDDPDEAISMLEKYREYIQRPGNFHVFVIGDVTKMNGPVSSWRKFATAKTVATEVLPYIYRQDVLSAAGQNPGNITAIIPVPGTDTSYSYHIARGISYSDPRYPALKKALGYLGAMDGPIWKAVRGAGLAYGVHLQLDVYADQFSVEVGRAPNAYRALAATKKVIEDHVDGTAEWSQTGVENAQGIHMHEVAESEASLYLAAEQSFINQFILKQDKHFNRKLLEKSAAVSLADMKNALKEVVLPCFDPAQSINVVALPAGKKDVIMQAFRDAGYPAEVRELKSFDEDYGFEYGLKDGEEEEDDEEDEEEYEDSSEEGDESSEDEKD